MSYQSPDLTFAEDLGTEVVDIYAGNKHYLVHKRLLTSKSDYFEKALNGQFKEAAENTIHLEDVEPTAVALLIGWLYRGSIPGMDRKLSPFTRSARTSSEESVPVPNAISINGTLVGYTPLQEMRDTIFGVSFFERLCHISAQPPYSSFSQEELRIADYTNSRRFHGDGDGVEQAAQPILPQPLTRPVTSFVAASRVIQPDLLQAPRPRPVLQQPCIFGAPVDHSAGNSSGTIRTYSDIVPPSNPDSASLGEWAAVTLALKREEGQNDHQEEDIRTEVDEESNSSKFGSTPFILYPEGTGEPIPGIPRSPRSPEASVNWSALQLAVIQLCIFAETICWPGLYNDAINAYIRGEQSMFRLIPEEHVELIYENTHPRSTLRKYVLENIFTSQNPTKYLELARKYDDLLEEIMRQINIPRPASPPKFDDAMIRSYYMEDISKGKVK